MKVNDEAVKTTTDRNYYFTLPSLDRELKLTFSRAGQMIEAKIHPQSTLANNLYDEWTAIIFTFRVLTLWNC